MILKEFIGNEQNGLQKLVRVLAENYDYELDLDNMSQQRAHALAARARKKVDETTEINKRIKFNLIAESLDLWIQANVQTELTSMVAEGLDDESMEEAKVILAAKELSDKIQGMIEDAAKMQVQDLLPIVDAMKSEIGTAEADAFSSAADTALSNLVETLKSAKDEYDAAIGTAQGNQPATDMDNFDADMDGDMGVDMDSGDELDMDDEFGGDDAEIGDDVSGRELKDED